MLSTRTEHIFETLLDASQTGLRKYLPDQRLAWGGPATGTTFDDDPLYGDGRSVDGAETGSEYVHALLDLTDHEEHGLSRDQAETIARWFDDEIANRLASQKIYLWKTWLPGAAGLDMTDQMAALLANRDMVAWRKQPQPMLVYLPTSSGRPDRQRYQDLPYRVVPRHDPALMLFRSVKTEILLYLALLSDNDRASALIAGLAEGDKRAFKDALEQVRHDFLLDLAGRDERLDELFSSALNEAIRAGTDGLPPGQERRRRLFEVVRGFVEQSRFTGPFVRHCPATQPRLRAYPPALPPAPDWFREACRERNPTLFDEEIRLLWKHKKHKS